MPSLALRTRSRRYGNAEKVSDDGAAVIVRARRREGGVTVGADCVSDEKSFTWSSSTG